MTDAAYQRPLVVGEMIDVFRIERVLGAGGFGITYLATDTSLHCYVAVKEYFPQNAWREQHSRVIRTNAGDANQSFHVGLDRFHREGQTLAQFNHLNIVKVRRLLQANGTAYLVMDYEQGETLESYLHRLGRPLSFQEAETIFNPLLDGLRAIHDRNLLHLDIKPANIFLRSDAIPVLIDFGGARHQLGQASHMVSFLVASDGYAPNEQYSGSQLQPATDIYAMAATIYYSITGKAPPDSPTRANAIIDGHPDTLIPASQSVKGGAYSPHFLQAVDVALSMPIANRPQSVREFQQRLFTRVKPNVMPEMAQHGTAYVQPSYPAQPIRQERMQSDTNWMPILFGVGGIIILLLGIVLVKMLQANPSQIDPNNPTQVASSTEMERPSQKQQEEDMLNEARRKAEAITQEAQQKLDEANQITAAAAVEAKRQADEAARQNALDAQRKQEEDKKRADDVARQNALDTQQKIQDQEKAELNKLANTVADYYTAIAEGNATKVKMLWKDPASDKAQKAYDNVTKGGGGACRVLPGEVSRKFNETFTHALLYMKIECDEQRQNRGMRKYTILFTLEKNDENNWRIVDREGVN